MPYYCYEGCPATWYVSAEFMPLIRDQGGSLPFASRGPAYIREQVAIESTADPPGPTEYADLGQPIPDIVLGTADFEPELDPGLRILIGRRLGDWYRLEASWRGGYSWSDSVTVRDRDSDLYSPFSNFGDPNNYVGEGIDPADNFVATAFPGLDENSFASISFSSRMNDAELNLRRRVEMRRGGAVHERIRGIGEASFLVGLRYMDINETFNYLTESDGGANRVDVDVETNNDMFGVQIGALAQILVDERAWVDVDIKGVAFFNQASQGTVYSSYSYPNDVLVPDDDSPFTSGDEADRTSFMGDLSVTFNYQFTPHFTFRAGYNAMWLKGLALADENFETNIETLELGPGRLVHDGSVTYHGPQIGFVWAR
jgi:hypothetical protein